MSANPEQALIYHITDVENLPGILAEGGLRPDSVMAEKNPTVIGYGHIKERLKIMEEDFSFLSAEERRWIFGETALSLWPSLRNGK